MFGDTLGTDGSQVGVFKEGDEVSLVGESASEMFGDTLGMDGSQVGVFEEGDEVSLSGKSEMFGVMLGTDVSVGAKYYGWMVTRLT